MSLRRWLKRAGRSSTLKRLEAVALPEAPALSAAALRGANRARTEAMLHNIRRAMFYPAVVFSVSTGSIVLMLYYFVPVFLAAVNW